MFKKTIGKYIFVAPAVRKGKKYSVYNKSNGKYITSFGALNYEHFKDKIGHYKSLNHLDKQRRKLYFQRHGHTTDKTSAKYFSNKFLW